LYLVDTNVWLERLLDQNRSDEAGQFFTQIPSDSLFITDFALHSIGLVLARLGQLNTFGNFVQDLFVNGAVTLVRLASEDMMELISVSQRFSLDFDDAYQYVAAGKYNLTLVSFDTDFDRTDVDRKTPGQVI
jgi:predicted nucleic acid-binding protein